MKSILRLKKLGKFVRAANQAEVDQLKKDIEKGPGPDKAKHEI